MSKFLKFLVNPGMQLIFSYRIYSFLFKFSLTKPLSYILYYFSRIYFSSDIHPNAKIGKNFTIHHHYGITIGKNVIIADNVAIFNGVSLGQRNKYSDRMPKIENDVVVYKGATIIGDGTISEGTLVAAHELIKFDSSQIYTDKNYKFHQNHS